MFKHISLSLHREVESIAEMNAQKKPGITKGGDFTLFLYKHVKYLATLILSSFEY